MLLSTVAAPVCPPAAVPGGPPPRPGPHQHMVVDLQMGAALGWPELLGLSLCIPPAIREAEHLFMSVGRRRVLFGEVSVRVLCLLFRLDCLVFCHSVV